MLIADSSSDCSSAPAAATDVQIRHSLCEFWISSCRGRNFPLPTSVSSSSCSVSFILSGIFSWPKCNVKQIPIIPTLSLYSIEVVARVNRHRRSAIVFRRLRPSGELGEEEGGLALPSPRACKDRFPRISIIWIDSSPAIAISLKEVETLERASHTLTLNGGEGYTAKSLRKGESMES